MIIISGAVWCCLALATSSSRHLIFHAKRHSKRQLFPLFVVAVHLSVLLQANQTEASFHLSPSRRAQSRWSRRVSSLRPRRFQVTSDVSSASAKMSAALERMTSFGHVTLATVRFAHFKCFRASPTILGRKVHFAYSAAVAMPFVKKILWKHWLFRKIKLPAIIPYL